jgi:hypothetical protein
VSGSAGVSEVDADIAGGELNAMSGDGGSVPDAVVKIAETGRIR